MAEWLNAAVLKTVKDASPSGVRIPVSPHDLVIYITEVTQNSKTACYARESGHPLCKNKRKNGFPLSWEWQIGIFFLL